jgi:hypothetical protein
MGKKLARGAWPANHGPNDFKCFGPPVTKDGEFIGTKICDMGCFMQEAVDSNKYYHASIVQSTKTKSWYVYFEYARVGAPNPSIQFVECDSESDAEAEYVKQLKSKNVGRGVWENHSVLGKRLVPKIDRKGKPKDLYIVRPQATRSTGLPDAKTITCDEGLDEKRVQKKPIKGSKKSYNIDRHTVNLMRDLKIATVKYTKASMADAAIPTQTAIDNGRAICQEALKRIKFLGGNINDQVQDWELKQLTRDLYGLIPKKKNRGAAPESWILSQQNVLMWQQDLDAFESALYTADLGSIAVDDPLGGIPLARIQHITPRDSIGEFVYNWMPKASKNVHSNLRNLKIRNAWIFERVGDTAKLLRVQKRIAADGLKSKNERVSFQPKTRPDLTAEEAKLAAASNTALVFHGSRSVNLSGILRESLRLPKQLVGVAITGAMLGPGLYWASDWRKSAGYTSLRNSYWSGGSGGIPGRGGFMFIADVALGNIFVAPKAKGYVASPKEYHSVMGKGGFTSIGAYSNLQNDEHVTYETDSHRLRFLVEFEA